jgi:hypothetical protein
MVCSFFEFYKKMLTGQIKLISFCGSSYIIKVVGLRGLNAQPYMIMIKASDSFRLRGLEMLLAKYGIFK